MKTVSSFKAILLYGFSGAISLTILVITLSLSAKEDNNIIKLASTFSTVFFAYLLCNEFEPGRKFIARLKKKVESIDI
jgi:hypothetical protein